MTALPNILRVCAAHSTCMRYRGGNLKAYMAHTMTSDDLAMSQSVLYPTHTNLEPIQRWIPTVETAPQRSLGGSRSKDLEPDSSTIKPVGIRGIRGRDKI